MAEKQLIVAVEGTAAMGPCWATVVSDYLDKIIRVLVFVIGREFYVARLCD
ncbi:hypothetical protein C1H46_044093 [Malus baccata]|uniref:Uncharacterized protein n=1 Tax=Malus baccata TaxID=106549 RepID=A0A540K809_MALBA|nr:hypothetical protein C1H46_044093 [Malus baccata]